MSALCERTSRPKRASAKLLEERAPDSTRNEGQMSLESGSSGLNKAETPVP